MGVRKIDLDLCNGCGICFERCPTDVFRWDDKTNKPYIMYLRDCQSCLLCERECPTDAVLVHPEYELRIPRAWPFDK